LRHQIGVLFQSVLEALDRFAEQHLSLDILSDKKEKDGQKQLCHDIDLMKKVAQMSFKKKEFVPMLGFPFSMKPFAIK
jgi:hypothetical protein